MLDRAYLAAHATGVDGLAEAVAPFELEASAARCGLPETDLTDLLEAMGVSQNAVSDIVDAQIAGGGR